MSHPFAFILTPLQHEELFEFLHEEKIILYLEFRTFQSCSRIEDLRKRDGIFRMYVAAQANHPIHKKILLI